MAIETPYGVSAIAQDSTRLRNLDGVQAKDITRKHPEYDLWQRRWDDYRLLYRGGEEFLIAAGMAWRTRAGTGMGDGAIGTGIGAALSDLLGQRNQRRRFLYQLEGEPDTSYISRWERAVYINYYAAIIDYFRHWLFSQPPVIQPAKGAEPPDWFDNFQKDANGAGQSFMDFLKDAFLDACITRRSGWLPESYIRGNDTDGDDDRLTLCEYSAPFIFDWQYDEHGNLEWVVLNHREHVRDFPGDRIKVETFTFIDRQQWRTWEYREEGGKGELDVIDGAVHGLGEVPFIEFSLPHGLWPSNKLATWQIDQFNRTSMLNNSLLLSCFLQPAITSNDADATSRIFGDSTVLHLRSGTKGMDDAEDFRWIAPDPTPLKFVAEQLLSQRDEGYRIVHQMSLAVDSQAIGAIARSGVSKIEDRRASEIILAAYGGYLRDAILKTLRLLSKIYGDETEWEISGFDNFQVSTLDEELQKALLISSLNIKSVTARAEIEKELVVGSLLAHASEDTKTKVRKETDEGFQQEEEQKQEAAMGPSQVVPGVDPANPMQSPIGAKKVPNNLAQAVKDTEKKQASK